MKLAGVTLGLIGTWGLVTLVASGLIADANNVAYTQVLADVAPFTALGMCCVGAIIGGTALYDRGERR
jgi:hypothetical protein